MAKYRKKPVVIEARQLIAKNRSDAGNIADLVLWIRGFGGDAWHDGINIYIKTSEGTNYAQSGNYIVRDTGGEFRFCEPEVFQDNFELIEE